MSENSDQPSLVKDSNCGKMIDKKTAEFKYRQGNTIHYFCSAACQFAFIERAVNHPNHNSEGMRWSGRSGG